MTNHTPLETKKESKSETTSPSTTNHTALQTAYEASLQWLDSLPQRPVGVQVDYKTLKKPFDESLPPTGTSAENVIEELIEKSQPGLLSNAGGRFFGWVIGGVVPSALAADWLTSSWDQNGAIYDVSPLASVIEEVTGKWLIELFDLPRESSFALTTGTQMAHFTSLSAARYRVLKNAGWNVNTQGLFGAPTIKVITSEFRHESVDRALRYLGIGSASHTKVQADENGHIKLDDFKKELNFDGPIIISLDAADLNMGAFDPFKELIPLVKEKNAWVHVDGAFGLFARASRSKKHLTEGLELADSWAVDGHKWLNVPQDCGVALVKDSEAHRNSLTIEADYFKGHPEARDQIEWNPEWSRRARTIPVYAALKELGKQGVEDIVDRCCNHCNDLIEQVSRLSSVEILWRPILNQGLFRILSPKDGATEEDHRAQTLKVLAAVNKSGEAFFAPAIWRGKTVIRVSVVNWRTTSEDITRTAKAFETALKEQKNLN